MAGGVVPDLAAMPVERHELWDEIVLQGSMLELGMPKFDDILTPADSEAIRQYVIKRAHDRKQVQLQSEQTQQTQ